MKMKNHGWKLPEDVTDDTMKEIDDNVDPNYIKEEK